LACLPDGDVADALRAFESYEDRLRLDEAREVHYLLFRVTGDRAHIVEAKRLLDEAAAPLDDESRLSMRTNVRLNREILAAWKKEFGEGGDPPDDDPPTESPTRAG
jgi:hypothetical protein